MESNFFCYAATVVSPHRKVLIFAQRMHTPTGRLFYVLNDFDQSQELKTIAKKKLTILQDFCVIQDSETRFCYMENGWKVRMNICTALWTVSLK